MSENQIRRDLQTKRARVAYLVTVVRENLPRTAQRFADGYFTTAAEDLHRFSTYAAEIIRLNEEISQLQFDLEWLFPAQADLPELAPA